jgi:hypothetical protein
MMSQMPRSALSYADKHLHAERLDGCYVLKTSREDLSGDELRRIYILLTRAENAFRDMKSPLAERPIWHHLERRTDTHIFLCVLAGAKPAQLPPHLISTA